MILGIPEIANNIFNYLNKKCLINILQVNIAINDKYDNDIFWLSKINQLIPNLCIPEEYKNNEKILYFKLDDLRFICKRSKLTIPYSSFIEQVILWALMRNHLNILKRFSENHRVIYLVTLSTFYSPYINFYTNNDVKISIELVKWITGRHKNNFVNRQRGYVHLLVYFYEAVEISNNIEVLNFLNEQFMIKNKRDVKDLVGHRLNNLTIY